jgi:tripartite-type tricarboxylate transporter receptor subunit TctC
MAVTRKIASMNRAKGRVALSVLILCAGHASCAMSAEYPTRPIRVIVSSAPGGGTDLTWRLVEPRMSQNLGQSMVLDNRGGAGGDVGANLVAISNPDGYTLLGGVSSITINPAFKKDMPYNMLRDLAPVSLAVKAPNLLVSHPSVPASTVPQLIAYLKAQPKPVQYASAGVGSMPHLMMELFQNLTGVKLLQVSYKGTGQAQTEVLGGQLPLMMGNVLPTLPHIASGRLRAYAVTSAARSAAAPNIPTLAESGVSGYEAVQWFGMWAPAKTPKPIVAKLHAALTQALNDPALKKRFADDGAETAPSASPAEFDQFIRSEMDKWAKVIRAAGIQMQ